ncbi:hypothetical protein ICJ04_02020 [Stenotrophomonas sp. 169]|uniref:hypothetical protein n=1 Tax=Stenotrophomonas sp. 169 TaxID=2770322 RepID=UPI0016626EC4|nr:hypothetical protein [Stenotrophomonas sp. 169]QNR97720.1 hypothetical protein ICJ04_02020 [Stenotrophomonas sp. 169]
MRNASKSRSQLSYLLLIVAAVFALLGISVSAVYLPLALMLFGAASVQDARWQMGVVLACIVMGGVWGGYQIGKERALADSKVTVEGPSVRP